MHLAAVESDQVAAAPRATPPQAQLPADEIAAGTALVEAFLEEWASRTSALPPAADEGATAAELDALVGVYEEYKERFEGSAWAREVLAKTY